jgi:hypothetical protein
VILAYLLEREAICFTGIASQYLPKGRRKQTMEEESSGEGICKSDILEVWDGGSCVHLTFFRSCTIHLSKKEWEQVKKILKEVVDGEIPPPLIPNNYCE